MLQHHTAHRRAVLVSPDGTRVELPDEVYDILLEVVSALAQGLAVTIAPQDATLTTQQAAALLGISRPTLVRLLDRAEIPSTRPGRHRRVLLADVLDYRQRLREQRRELLDQMTVEAEDAGLYELPLSAPISR